MNLPKEKRNRLILVIIVGLILVSSLWYGLVSSGKDRLTGSRDRRAAAKDKVEKATARVGQADKVEAEAESAVQALRSMEEDMAAGVDLYRWSYLLLEKARGGHEVEIAEVTRPQTNDIGALPAFPYPAATFTVQGNAYYHDFGKFLAGFENRFPYFRVQNISLGTLADSGPDVVAARVVKDKLLFRMEIVVPIKLANETK
jgi:hypothetical protein